MARRMGKAVASAQHRGTRHLCTGNGLYQLGGDNVGDWFLTAIRLGSVCACTGKHLAGCTCRTWPTCGWGCWPCGGPPPHGPCAPGVPPAGPPPCADQPGPAPAGCCCCCCCCWCGGWKGLPGAPAPAGRGGSPGRCCCCCCCRAAAPVPGGVDPQVKAAKALQVAGAAAAPMGPGPAPPWGRLAAPGWGMGYGMENGVWLGLGWYAGVLAWRCVPGASGKSQENRTGMERERPVCDNRDARRS